MGELKPNTAAYAGVRNELLLTREQIASRVTELGKEITRDYAGKDLMTICILKGAVVFFVDLIRAIELPLSMDFMAISSYGLRDNLKSRGAASLRIATLLDKPDRRRVPLHVDYCGFIIPDEFVVGYGLDYDERYRNLPDIGVLLPEVYGNT